MIGKFVLIIVIVLGSSPRPAMDHVYFDTAAACLNAKQDIVKHEHLHPQYIECFPTGRE